MAIEGKNKKNITAAAANVAASPAPEPEPVNAAPEPADGAPTPAPSGNSKGRQPGPRDTPSMQWNDEDGSRRKAILLALRELQAEPVATISIDQLVTKLATRNEFQVAATLKGKETDFTLADLLSPTNVRAEVHKWERQYWAKGLDMYTPEGEVVVRWFDKDGEPVKERTEGATARELRGKGFPKLIAGRKASVELNFDLDEI